MLHTFFMVLIVFITIIKTAIMVGKGFLYRLVDYAIRRAFFIDSVAFVEINQLIANQCRLGLRGGKGCCALTGNVCGK